MFGRISFIFLILSLCPLTLSAVEMKISSDATIQNLATGEKHKYTAQDNFIYNDKQPLWVESTGKIPILLVPLKSESGVINIDSPNVSQVLKEEKDLKIDKELSEVILQLTEIHRIIAEKKFTVALQRVGELKLKYPEVKFLEFIEASVAFLVGDKQRAISSLEVGLKAHPDYVQGLELKKQLTGGGTK